MPGILRSWAAVAWTARSIVPPVLNYLRLAKSLAGARLAMPRRLLDSNCLRDGSFMQSGQCGRAEAAARMNCSRVAIDVAWNWRKNTKPLRSRFRPSAPVFIDFRQNPRHALPYARWQNMPTAAESQLCTLSALMPRLSRSMPAYSQVEVQQAFATFAETLSVESLPAQTSTLACAASY